MFQLQVLSPTGEVFNDQIDELTVPTARGEISVLQNHASLVSKLTEGTLTIRKSGEETIIAIIGGFLEVKNEVMTILSDYAIPASSIQVAQIKEAKRKAEELLSKKESNANIIIAQKELQKSILALKVADKLKMH